MTDETSQEGLKQRITRQGEDALGKLAQDLLENPLLNGALTHALDAQKKAAQAQEVAMGALNIPSASDIERLTRRVRSVSQRLEGIEDGLDRLDENLDRAAGAGAGASAERLERMEAQLQELARQIAALADAIPGAAAPVPRNQERMRVGE
jgi:chromosome segregation ATPase